MTTPQLDVLTIRKQKEVGHYAHIVHAPIDVHSYRFYAFDCFDSIFCSGSHQIESIRQLEETRKTPPKQLFKTGLTYYDEMLASLDSSNADLTKSSDPKPTVLVAPTWKSYSLLNTYGVDFFERLLNGGEYNVVLRPHPQSFVSYPKLIEEITLKFGDHPRFELDTASSGSESLAKASLLISDLSGVVYDFAFLHGKPVLLMDTQPDMRGYESSCLRNPAWEMKTRTSLGRVLTKEDLPHLTDEVEKLLNTPPSRDIIATRNSSIYNFGKSGKATAKQIIEIVDAL